LWPCSQCYAWTDHDPCAICASPNRNTSQICVVAEYSDLSALERTNEYRGLYHVLNGLISPLAGVGPEDLTIRALLDRLQASRPSGGEAVTASPSSLGNSINPMAVPSSHHPVHEVILALPPSVEGDTTSLYLSRQLQAMGIQITRIGFGLPVGGDLEYADTLDHHPRAAGASGGLAVIVILSVAKDDNWLLIKGTYRHPWVRRWSSSGLAGGAAPLRTGRISILRRVLVGSGNRLVRTDSRQYGSWLGVSN
jgi:recombinational DNA repair protein RecR